MQCLIVLLSIVLRWRQQPPGYSRCWAGGWSLESYLLTASTFQGEPKVFFTLQGGFEPLSFNWRTGEQIQYLGGICGTIWCSPGHTNRSTFLFVGLLYIYICKYIIMRLCLWPLWWHTNPYQSFLNIFSTLTSLYQPFQSQVDYREETPVLCPTKEHPFLSTQINSWTIYNSHRICETIRSWNTNWPPQFEFPLPNFFGPFWKVHSSVMTQIRRQTPVLIMLLFSGTCGVWGAWIAKSQRTLTPKDWQSRNLTQIW